MAGATLLGHFSALDDPRQPGKVVYPLPEIMPLVSCATLAGAEDFVEVRLWGREKLSFLRSLLPFRRGIPSHDPPQPARVRCRPEGPAGSRGGAPACPCPSLTAAPIGGPAYLAKGRLMEAIDDVAEVLTGGGTHAADNMAALGIAGVEFVVAKPCRCWSRSSAPTG